MNPMCDIPAVVPTECLIEYYQSTFTVTYTAGLVSQALIGKRNKAYSFWHMLIIYRVLTERARMGSHKDS